MTRNDGTQGVCIKQQNVMLRGIRQLNKLFSNSPNNNLLQCVQKRLLPEIGQITCNQGRLRFSYANNAGLDRTFKITCSRNHS